MSKKLTLGMAVYDDFHGAYFTVQAALMYHGEHIGEVILIDNNPNSFHGVMLKQFANNAGPHIRHIPFTEGNSTAITRNKVFELANNELVICVDPHILFQPGALAALVKYYEDNPGTRDLIQGPLLYDNQIQVSSHFNFDMWRAEMWGTWDTDPRVRDGQPFEIPGQGLGVFSCRKEAWLGFNPAMRGFGGEEGYIHEKYRQAGHKTICLPQLTWLHRFGRPDGVPYPLTKYDKVRNYVLGHKELGLSLEPIYKHFVGEKYLSEMEWDSLKDGNIPNQKACACQGDKFKTLDDWLTYVTNQPSDINEHTNTLRMFAADRRVVDYGHRNNVSSVALAAGKPKTYTMVSPAQPAEWALLANYLKDIKPTLKIAKEYIEEMPECDLLFLDTMHTYDYMSKFLAANAGKVRDFIIIHDTVTFGEHGEDSKAGIMPAVREFLRNNRKRWSVYEHHRHNHGLLILCGNDEFRKELPKTLRQASNFFKALSKHVAGGLEKVTGERYELRLIQCDECPSRNGERCGECGCPIEAKASWAKEQCPLGKWESEAANATAN